MVDTRRQWQTNKAHLVTQNYQPTDALFNPPVNPFPVSGECSRIIECNYIYPRWMKRGRSGKIEVCRRKHRATDRKAILTETETGRLSVALFVLHWRCATSACAISTLGASPLFTNGLSPLSSHFFFLLQISVCSHSGIILLSYLFDPTHLRISRQHPAVTSWHTRDTSREIHGSGHWGGVGKPAEVENDLWLTESREEKEESNQKSSRVLDHFQRILWFRIIVYCSWKYLESMKPARSTSTFPEVSVKKIKR